MGFFKKLFGKSNNQVSPFIARREPIVVPMVIPQPEAAKTNGEVHESGDLRERIESALEELRPYLQGDGGDVELIQVNSDGVVEMHFVGACHGCPSAAMTLKHGIEATLKERIPEIKEVIAV